MEELPPLFARWMSALVPEGIPRETVATCGHCVMLPSAGAAPGATFFDATTRCCTYLPELHNFQVGRVLAGTDGDPVGRASVVDRVARGVRVTPLGLGRPRSYLLLYDDGAELVFGRSQAMRCPHHLDDGRCGVWTARESTCATWFCKHVRGKTGHDVWMAVKRVLGVVERDLGWWCVGELGLEPAAIDRLLHDRRPRVSAAELDRLPDPAQRDLWGSWSGREHEYYVACAARVEALAWPEVVAICGPELARAVEVLRAAVARATAAELPARLALGPLTVTSLRDEACTARTYNAYDPIALPMPLLEALDAFDGRATDEVRTQLAQERGIELDDDLIRKLVDFGVLVETPPVRP